MHMIEILNDHRNLTYFQMSQNPNCQKIHWSLFLSRFDFSLIHRLGRHLAKPDALPHQPDHQAEEEEDNWDQVVLSPKWFHGSAEPNKSSKLKKSFKPSEFLTVNGVSPSSLTLEGKETDFLDWVCNCTCDTSVIQVLKELGTE